MRVTNQMMADRTVFNLSRNASRFMRIQNQLSTGRQINTPSDDPIGTQLVLGYKTRLSELEQYISNIEQAKGRLTFYEDSLTDLKNLFESANLTATTMANDTFTGVEREAAANEIDSLYQQILQLGNKQINGRFIFAGHRIRTTPLMASTNGVIYNGDIGTINIEPDDGSRIRTNLNGQDIFFRQLSTLGDKSDIRGGLTGTTLVADLNAGNGIDNTPGTFEVYDANRDVTYTIDISAANTVNDVLNAINTTLGAGSNISAAIASAGNSFVWQPTIGTANSATDQTPLSNLNNGGGVDQSPGSFTIRNADSSISFTVDISSASTLGEARTLINNAITAEGLTNVSVGFNANGTGLAVSDTNGVPLGLTIEDPNSSQSTAEDLGIAGSVGANLDGRDLQPIPDFTIREIGAQTTGTDLGIIGHVVHDTVMADIRPRLTLTSTLASLNNNAGYTLGEIEISQGDRTVTLDLGNASLVTVSDLLDTINSAGLDITASINADETGIQIVNNVADRTLTVKSTDSTRTAHELGIVGSPDMLGTMLLLSDALHNNDREMAGALMGNLEKAMQELLGSRAETGTRIMRLTTTGSRHESTQIQVQKLLSEVQDADLISLVTAQAREESLYQAALLASSKIIQLSLVDFLR
ncbi:MAG: flagellar hook-associated protein FlgL [candidate division Zixibacteria bacterium]|nr:flagellar hook-associated protein FlgL [candidate division Zixibacteria bacterium]